MSQVISPLPYAFINSTIFFLTTYSGKKKKRK